MDRGIALGMGKRKKRPEKGTLFFWNEVLTSSLRALPNNRRISYPASDIPR